MATRNLKQIQGQRVGKLSQPNMGVRFQGKLTRYATASVFVIALMSLPGREAHPQETSRGSYKSNAVTNEAARLSDSVYDLEKTPNGYTLIHKSVGADGFQAAAYQNHTTKQVFVVYAGTNDGTDWKGNRELGKETFTNQGSSPTLDSQTNQAMTFFEEAKAKATEAGTSDIVVAGHSQGGYHAQLVGAKYGATTRTFEAPGVPESALERHGISIGASLDIVNTVRESSPIGNLGNHIGQTVRIPDVDGPNPVGLTSFNHDSKMLAEDITSNAGRVITNRQLEEQRAAQFERLEADRANQIDLQNRLRNLPSDNPFEKLIDTSSWDKRVSDYKREATAEIGDASRRIDQKWGQTLQDLARQPDQVRKQYDGARDGMAGAAGPGAFPVVNPQLSSGRQPAPSQPAASQPTRLQTSPSGGISSGQGRVNQPKQSGSVTRRCDHETGSGCF